MGVATWSHPGLILVSQPLDIVWIMYLSVGGGIFHRVVPTPYKSALIDIGDKINSLSHCRRQEAR